MTLHKGDPRMSDSASPKEKENGEGQSSKGSSSSGGGTGRRQLPSIPDFYTEMGLASKMNDKGGKDTPKGNHSYAPAFLEYSILAEYNMLQKHKIPGIYVIPSAKSALYWNGVLFIREGLYQEGVFRFNLYIPDNYPEGESPRLVFDPPVFHPVIDPESGELDVKRGFPKWRRNVNHIWHVLLYARRVFYKIDTKSPLNSEAAVLYEQDLEQYKQKVSEAIKTCKEKLYEAPNTDDPHAIRFSPWDPAVHEEAMGQVLQPKMERSHSTTSDQVKSDDSSSLNSRGLSWMGQGNQIFSREDSASA